MVDPDKGRNSETLTLEIEDGCLADLPADGGYLYWMLSPTHGRNWLARITGIGDDGRPVREFMPKVADGKLYYVVRNLKTSDAVEFGADYVERDHNGRVARRKKSRWYGVVTQITQRALTLQRSQTLRAALRQSQALRTALPPSSIA